MTIRWMWKPILAGMCGAAAHSFLMLARSKMGLLPSFQPYERLQIVLNHLIGGDVHPVVPLLLSFLSGATLIGFVFARVYRSLPGRYGAVKGSVFALFGWLALGAVFFPALGLGFFAVNVGLGIAPALLSLAMLLTYGIVMGTVYAKLDTSF